MSARQRPTRLDYERAIRIAFAAHAVGDGHVIGACRAIILARRLGTKVSEHAINLVREFDDEEAVCAVIVYRQQHGLRGPNL